MKCFMRKISEHLRHRLRMCIWKYWKKPMTKYKDNSTQAWLVFRNGRLSRFSVTSTDYGGVTYTGGGVRPVITISKSNIS